MFSINGGNKTGEIHTNESQGTDGFGCVFFIIFVLAAILAWPALIIFILNGYVKDNEVWWLILFLILYLTSSVLNTHWTVKKENFSFVSAWVRIALLNTIMVGGSYWLIGGIVNHFSISVFFSAFFLSFLLSIESSCICAIIAMLIRKKRLNKREFEK